MAVIIKCKMCGGDLALTEGSTIAECEYCGTQQTVPAVDDDKKARLYNRANQYRMDSEFDKAAGVYESIVADFPEEAEAYWGLILCKFGIEYVDDPKTGKKIPTCHRSSYDSIMDDPDLDKVLDNADSAARKLYQEEARQIEKLRKDILEVSGKEDPYDIFICYKETDKDGNRTVDSVLAQDLYTALTDKGYRVFFSRITLEDKLGQAYEPYIFAALNSAKVMLAVGTDYEHYNAVWVRNEWSRFLKLTDGTQKKVLIPCYKDIDAYDMPKEFRHLQAQDLGKVGAIQDLLRGVEKILPREKEPVQQTVVVQQAGQGNLDVLLKRGKMALEDGDWKKADGFFEEVLNQNAECAEAYLGKFLAKQETPDLESWVRKYRRMTLTAKTGTHSDLEPDTEHITEAVNQYAIEGYVDGGNIQELYQNFNLEYASELDDRIRQREMLDRFWERSNELTRAEQFATGETASDLQMAKEQLTESLNQQIAQAEESKQAAKEQRLAEYRAHLENVDVQVAQVYEDGQNRREREYQRLLQVKQECTPEQLLEYAKSFDKLKDYKDSRELAKWCREENARILSENRKAQEEQRRRIEAQQQTFREYQAECQAKNMKLFRIFLIVAAALFAIGVICLTVSMSKTETDGEPIPVVAAVIASILFEAVTNGLLILFTAFAAKFTEKTIGGKNRWVIPSRIFAIIGILTSGILFLAQVVGGEGLGEMGLWAASVFALHLTAFIVPFFRKKL